MFTPVVPMVEESRPFQGGWHPEGTAIAEALGCDPERLLASDRLSRRLGPRRRNHSSKAAAISACFHLEIPNASASSRQSPTAARTSSTIRAPSFLGSP